MKYRCISPVFKGRVNQGNIRFCYRSIPATLFAKLTKGDRDMRKIVVVIIVLGLMGCKSLDYVRSTQPVLQGKTSKSVDEFTVCVSSKWSGSGGHITSLPISGGTSIQVPQPMGGYDVVLDVTRTENGGNYVLYERMAALTSSFYSDSVKQCQ